MAEQVLTTADRAPVGNGFSEQEPISLADAVGRIVYTYSVKQSDRTRPEAKTPPPAKKAGGGFAGRKGKRRKSKKPRHGGWRSTRFISHGLYREARGKAGLLAHKGYPFTVFATARPPLGKPDAEAKRHIGLAFARLGQALERNGHPHIGMTTYENPLNGRLHGHQLLHVRREALPIVKRWAQRWEELTIGRRWAQPWEPVESVDLHARPAVRSDLQYAMKEHKFAGPFEHFRKFYEQSKPIVGPRVSFTKMAKAILVDIERRMAKLSASPVLRVIVNDRALVAEPVQLTLFPEKERPVSRLAHFAGHTLSPAVTAEIEARRQWRGLTQAQLARQIGVSRPQLVNALQGRFGLSEWASARLREFLLAEATPVAQRILELERAA